MKRLGICLFLIFILGCASAPQTTSPGQLVTRDMETRDLVLSYDAAYRAATNAFFALGYTIKHTDKITGIIVGSKSDPGRGKKALWIVLFGVPGALIDTKTNYDITVMVVPKTPAITTIRIGASLNGEPVINKDITDKVWTVIEREAMVDEGPSVKPKEAATPPPSQIGKPQEKKSVAQPTTEQNKSSPISEKDTGVY
jgi:hypothetical protein